MNAPTLGRLFALTLFAVSSLVGCVTSGTHDKVLQELEETKQQLEMSKAELAKQRDEEAAKAKGKNVITRAVGHKDYVQVDTADVDVAVGDRYFLCTDGFHNYLRSNEELVELVGGDSLQTGVEAAVALANHRGGKDNITVVACEIIG